MESIKAMPSSTNVVLTPVVVGCRKGGAVAIVQHDGSSATRLNGIWQPGIAFDIKDFLDMPVIKDNELRTSLLEQAAEALASKVSRPITELQSSSTARYIDDGCCAMDQVGIRRRT